MANRPPTATPQLSRRTKSLLIIGAVALVVLLGGARLVDIYVDWAWFGEVGFRGVFTTVLWTRVIQFLVAAALLGGLLALNLVVAYRVRPVFVPVAGADDPVARYRTVVLARLRWFAIGIPAVVALVAGLSAQADWQTVQLFLNATPFGVTDPVFGNDIGFYVFELPFYRWLLDWVFVAIAVSFVAALVAHYLFGGIRLAGRNGAIASATRAHLAVLAGSFVLFKAVAYFFDRYELLFSDRKAAQGGANFFGASYTDLNAAMPAKLILLIIAVICAGAFFAAVVLRNLQIPAIALALLVLSSILVGAAWPAVLEQFSVRPNANDREAESISRNIAATRQAFGLTDVQVVPYAGTTDQSAGAVQNAIATNQATVPNIRLLDPGRLARTFTQLEQRRNFYGFNDRLDIDRYALSGQAVQDYIVAAREINPNNLSANQQDWINRHLVYTHGNGFVAAPANRVNAAVDENGGQGGYPQFQVSDLDNPGPFNLQQPRIYYGELVDSPDDYAIVGATEGAPPREYDSDSRQYTYTGPGGVSIGNWASRLVFAAAYGERNILFNGSIGDNSRIMYNRSPVERVQKVAPWLELDSDPYPVVVGGQMKWVVDGYTTLPRYPYAQQVPLADATRDSAVGPNGTLIPENAGYMRNSVKATVDAYTGKVDLYQVDPADPVLQTWMKAFPGVVQAPEAISPELRSHFRYPEDLFKVQRDLLTRYHVEDPREFYSTVSFWDVPSDPTTESGAAGAPLPPYFLLADDPQPGARPTAQFQLTSALVSLRREFLSAYMSVSSDPATYGRITLLQLPADTQTRGPQQVQTQFLSSAQVSTELNLLRQQGTQVLYGNLLTLPVAGGLLYVEPVYIERTNQESSFPQLSRVLVSFGGRIGYAPTLPEALTQVFGSAGAAQQIPGATVGTQPTPPSQAATPGTPQQGQAPSGTTAAPAGEPRAERGRDRHQRRPDPAAHRAAER